MLNDPEGRILRNLVTATCCVLEGVEVTSILVMEGALLLQVLDDTQREELPLEAADLSCQPLGLLACDSIHHAIIANLRVTEVVMALLEGTQDAAFWVIEHSD